FFFSSRRRHTRSDRDWSSDVCSSDLRKPRLPARAEKADILQPFLHALAIAVFCFGPLSVFAIWSGIEFALNQTVNPGLLLGTLRSEERRVGKEWKTRWVAVQLVELST